MRQKQASDTEGLLTSGAQGDFGQAEQWAAPALPPIKQHKRSTGQARCETCDCLVPAGSWSQHAAGIRHRRNVLSMRMYGEPGHHIVSSFEAAAMPLAPVSANLVTKDPVIAAARLRERAASHSEASTSSAASDKAGTKATEGTMSPQRLQHLLLRELAGQAGLGQMYNRAAARFSEQALASAAQRVQRELEHHAQRPGGGVSKLVLGTDSGWPAADIACLVPHVSSPDCQWAELSLTVPYHTFGPEAAAVTTACSVLASSLPSNRGLRRVTLRFARADFLRILEQGGTGTAGLSRLWGYVLGSLRRALQANAAVLEVVLEAPPGTFAPEDVSSLQSAMLTAPPRLRLAALLGAHPRAGRGSPLGRLPHELLCRVVAQAVPPQRRSLLLRLQEPLMLNPDTTSSSDDDGDSDDDSDSDSDEEVEEAESEGPPSPHDHADVAVAAAAATGHFGAFSRMAMPSSSD